jgi:hypothetical protein
MLSKNNTENIYIVHDVYQMLFTVKPHFIAPDSSPNLHTAMKLSSPDFFSCKNPRYNAKLAYPHPPRCQKIKRLKEFTNHNTNTMISTFNYTTIKCNQIQEFQFTLIACKPTCKNNKHL